MVNLDYLENKQIACLTLDIERDFGSLLNEPRYEGLQYIDVLGSFLSSKKLPLTCFIQGSILETHPAVIKQLSLIDVEFELHSYSHPRTEIMNAEFEIRKGKETYEEFFGWSPIGYRAPSGVIDKKTYYTLSAYGFKFDSSIFPSIKPGVFNNINNPTKPYMVNGTLEFPFTVFSNIFRIPISLSYIMLIGKPYLYLLRNFKLPNLIIFDFHLHNLFKLKSSQEILYHQHSLVYRYVFNRIYHKEAAKGFTLLKDIVTILEDKGYRFLKMVDVYRLISNSK